MKKKKKASPIDFGSYSDLFMVMSFVFLFMYVVSSINTGITVIQERQRADTEKKNLVATVERYEKKIENDLDAQQKEEYEKLKAGLHRLKEDARLAREYQEKMAQAARQKEQELDVYQETIKAMMIDQLKVSDRIKQKDAQITKVTSEAATVIQRHERSIASLQTEVESKNEILEKKSAEIQKREQEIKKIAKRVDDLNHKEVLAESQAKELASLTQTLQLKESELNSVRTSEETLKREKDSLYKASIIQVNRLSREKEKIAEANQAELDALKQAQATEVKGLKDKYQKATEGLRKEIAESLVGKLRHSGLAASVDPSNGDVTVHFKNAYYDHNSSVLKDPMKEELKIFIPLYAKSLFANQKYASSISSVEIIGSSSPSYKGKYVNPRAVASLDEKKAMTYNLDLSYRRAKSIFDYTFLSPELAFDHKEQMIPLIKVSGTGYLQAMEEIKSLPETKQDKSKGFCGLYNCDVFQKVTLRFNLKDRVTQK